MKIPMLTTAILAAAACPAGAQEAQLSQHPRAGELAVLEFERSSANIAPGLELKLGEVAGWAKEHPDGKVVLDGYPDRKGDESIALHRVEAVRDILLTAGVDPDQLVIAAFDEPAGSRVVISGSHQTVDEVVAAHGNAAMLVYGVREPSPSAVAGQ
jgi:hypothetical protein